MSLLKGETVLKHIKPRDILEFFLYGIGIVALILIAGYLESAPLGAALWVAVILAVALWIVWFVIVARQRKQENAEPTLWMMQNGLWTAMDGSGRTRPARLREAAQLFDQDEAAIAHLDFDNKEQRA
ncbi:hypothetical protein PBI_CAMILLE_35 [Microbacterium phage Camille]|nr:hypothetical protein PBI_CAMILLE_35 [Microbacterium phage Camille]